MLEIIDGHEIYYEAEGEGKPVLLLHGWGCSTETVAPIFNRLKDVFRVYSLDFPGHGKSFTPDTPMTVGDYADITKRLMEKWDIAGCHVVAHSFGGRVTIKLAAQDDNTFDRIVLTGAAGIRPPRGFGYYWRVYTYKFMKRLAKLGFVRGLLKMFGVDVEKRIANAGSDDYKALPEAMRATFSKVVNEDLSGYLDDIKNPTLLIWGTEDDQTPLWMGEKMEKHISDSGLIKLEGAGHYAYLDRFEEFLVITRHFFDKG